MEIEMKKCCRCGRELPATEEYFGKNRNLYDGLQPYCRVCYKIRYLEGWMSRISDNRKFDSLVKQRDDLEAKKEKSVFYPKRRK